MFSFRDNAFIIGVIAVIALVIGGAIAVVVVNVNVHNHGIHSGVITDKDHNPMTSSVFCGGKPLMCHTTVIPESWDVTIAKDGKTNTFNLSENDWNGVKVSQSISFHGDTLVK